MGGKGWFAALAAALLCVPAFAEDGWIPLFNGKNLDGWMPKIKGYPLGENFANTFRVEDGLLKVRYGDEYQGEFKNRFGHLFYKTPYSRYLLRFEYRFVGEQLKDGPGWARRNNGLMLHGQDPATMRLDQDFPVSIEVQLLGGFETGSRSTLNLCTPGTNVEKDGKLYTPHGLSSTSETYRGDVWVTGEVEVRGSEKIIHRINGRIVLEYDHPQYDPTDGDAKKLIEANGGKLAIDRGTISIQSESAPCDFRKIELKVLE
ncbi:MAG: DUF1080 domain-containing protein [Kiritimatiellae bacterium]|nr:DUF1080 domain-containing protein [Kiritimatiellia bacterium]